MPKPTDRELLNRILTNQIEILAGLSRIAPSRDEPLCGPSDYGIAIAATRKLLVETSTAWNSDVG